MSKFKVGDRVRILDGSNIKDYAGSWYPDIMAPRVGDVSTIEEIVEKDDIVSYFLALHFPCCYMRWDERGLESVKEEQKIVITTDGKKTTTAKLYDGKKFVKSAKAVCSPDDKFDFGIGSALALERLVGNSEAMLPEETWYNGKVVCVDNQQNETLYTSGKIYEFKDGYMTNNNNLNTRFHNFKEFMSFTVSKFIEVVE